MKKNCFKNIWLASAAAFVFAFSASANVGAWNNDPFASQATSETSAAAGDVITNPTTEQTAPDAAIDDIEPETTDSEDIEEEIPTEETTTTQEVVIAPASSASEEITTQPPQPSVPSYAPTDSYTMYAPQVINVRSGPGTDYDKLGVVYANSAVTVVGSSGDWLAVSYNGQTGFILASLLSDTQPQTTTSAAPAATEPQQTEETTVSETEAAETSAPESIDEEPITNPVTQAPQTSETAQTSKTEAAAAVDNTGEGGFPPILLALICAAAAFLVVAVIPIAVLRIRHRNLYRY